MYNLIKTNMQASGLVWCFIYSQQNVGSSEFNIICDVCKTIAFIFMSMVYFYNNLVWWIFHQCRFQTSSAFLAAGEHIAEEFIISSISTVASGR